MKFNGEMTIEADRARVFAAINDAAFFASCLEGVEEIEQLGDNLYKGVLSTKIAYIGFRFAMEVSVTDMRENEMVAAEFVGEPIGVVGRVKGASVATLSDAEGGTKIEYEVDVSVAGKLGAIGQPVLRSKARAMERGFEQTFREKLGVSELVQS